MVEELLSLFIQAISNTTVLADDKQYVDIS